MKSAAYQRAGRVGSRAGAEDDVEEDHRGVRRREGGADGTEERGPRPNLTDFGQRLRSIGIIEAEHRRLGEHVGCTETRRM